MVDSGKQRIINRFNIKKKSKILVSGPITSWQIKGEKVETVIQFLFLGFKTTVDGDCSHETKKILALWKESCDKPRQLYIKKQKYHFAIKCPYSQSCGFSISHVWI